MQFHGGVYRSDDARRVWSEIGEGLPSDFGFPLVVDPADPDSAYVIPLKADMDRVTPGGRVRVYETRDAGETWAARGDGLPAEHAYLTMLREAFDRRGEGEGLELYFGATSGDVFGSADAGATWSAAADAPAAGLLRADGLIRNPAGSRVDESEGQPADQRAGDAAEAAQHHHAEGEHVVDPEAARARSRWSSRAACRRRRQRRAEAVGQRVGAADVDAHQPRGDAVLPDRPDRAAGPRVVEEEVEQPA